MEVTSEAGVSNTWLCAKPPSLLFQLLLEILSPLINPGFPLLHPFCLYPPPLTQPLLHLHLQLPPPHLPLPRLLHLRVLPRHLLPQHGHRPQVPHSNDQTVCISFQPADIRLNVTAVIDDKLPPIVKHLPTVKNERTFLLPVNCSLRTKNQLRKPYTV